MNFASKQKLKCFKLIERANEARNKWSALARPSWRNFQKVVDADVRYNAESQKFFVWNETHQNSKEDGKLHDMALAAWTSHYQEIANDIGYRKQLWNLTKTIQFKKLGFEQQQCIKTELGKTSEAKSPKYKKEITREIAFKQEALEAKFQSNLAEDRNIFGVYVKTLGSLKCLPKESKSAAKERALHMGYKGWMFEASNENYRAFQNTIGVDPIIKKEMRSERIKVGGSNKSVLMELAKIRRIEAKMNNERSYGNYAWSYNVLKTPAIMKKFLSLVEKSLQSGKNVRIAKATQLKYESLICSPSKAKDVLFELWNKWFDIEVEIFKTDSWLPNSEKFLLKRHGHKLGYITLDLYKRVGRPETDNLRGCMTDLMVRHKFHNGVVVLPDAAVLMSTSNTAWNHEDVLTFFHEMGHALHHISITSECPGTGWRDMEPDAIEWPSMFMQTWAWDSEVVCKLFGSNAVEVCDRVKNKEVRDSLEKSLKVAIVDMQMHASSRKHTDNPDVWENTIKKLSPSSKKILRNDILRWEHLACMRGTYAGYLYGERLSWEMQARLNNADRATWMELWELVFENGGRSNSVDALECWSPGIIKTVLG